MSKPTRTSRRRFMEKTIATGIGGLSVPYFVSADVLAQPGKPGANDRIQIGLIGAGGMGRTNLRNCARYPDVVVTGVCDVWRERRDQTVAKYKDTAKPYVEYRVRRQ